MVKQLTIYHKAQQAQLKESNMSNNIYNILGKLNALTESAEPAASQATVYETVEPRGSITEAVRSLESKYAEFKESKAKPDFLDVDGDGDKAEPFKKAVKDKKAGGEDESADKGMSAKQAKYFGKKKVSEGAGPYTLDDPKHPKFKANYEKYKKAHPDCKLADFVAAMRKKEQGISEGMDDLTDLDAYQFAEPDKDSAVKPASAKQTAADRRRRLQDLEDRRAEKNDSYSDTKSNVRKVAGKSYGGSAQKDGSELDEVAPPGAKAERMVKHIKKGYSQDGNLSKKEKGIAYATAWKAKNAGNLDEAVDHQHRIARDTVKNPNKSLLGGPSAKEAEETLRKKYNYDDKKIAKLKAELKKAKPAMVKESRVMEETDYFYEKVAKSLADKNPNLDTVGSDFVAAVRKEMIAQGIEPNRARNILIMDEDFLSDVATSYDHCCKEMHAETKGAPMNSHLGGMADLDEVLADPHEKNIPPPSSERPITKELDEIAALAGLALSPAMGEETDIMDEESEIYDTVNHEEVEDTMDEAVLDDLAYDDEELAEDDVAEGNEFSGALAAAKAAGEKEFEVDGKRYTVKEDINVSITANGEEDALNLFRKLAGMDEVAATPGVATIAMPQDLESALAQGVIAPMEEERDIEYSNTPNEKIAPISASIPSGNDMHKSKKSYSDKPYRGDNPMSVKEDAEDSLWKKYSGMLKSMILK